MLASGRCSRASSFAPRRDERGAGLMVRIRDDLPRSPDGRADVEAWLCEVGEGRRVLALAVDLIEDAAHLGHGLDVAHLLRQLEMDTDVAAAGLLYEAAHAGAVAPAVVRDGVGEDVAALLEALLRVGRTDAYELSDAPLLANTSGGQVENIRHLLASLIDDPRVAVVKLAERVVALRAAKSAPREAQERMADEALRVFAPLAGRLGIGQLKWALEDLAFRYRRPQDYRKIAASLDARRQERERQVQEAVAELRGRLAKAGIQAEVVGRAKHIYSIWLKMRRKGIDFSEVYDAQALRVVVQRVPECYATLGVVHTAWPHIPREFDDYIANPKDNGYRSIHTAVLGPVGKVLEVQIRTEDMHKESELGVCAHWDYKTGEGESLRSRKMQWLAQMLEWHDDAQHPLDDGDGAADRIYVATPQGHVIDLAQGATPVDFAYRIHTEVGHRCVGARVDGAEAPLNTTLLTGQTVEVLTGAAEAPRREWLNPDAGYVKTGRARAKIQAWLREQLADSNVRAGEELLLDTFERLDIAADLDALAQEAGYERREDLLKAVGLGDCQVIDLVRIAGGRPRQTEQLSLLPAKAAPTHSVQGIRVVGRNRPGLLRDVSSVAAAMGIDVASVEARVIDPGEDATISLEVRVEGVLQLALVIDRIRRVPSVRDVRRA